MLFRVRLLGVGIRIGSEIFVGVTRLATEIPRDWRIVCCLSVHCCFVVVVVSFGFGKMIAQKLLDPTVLTFALYFTCGTTCYASVCVIELADHGFF